MDKIQVDDIGIFFVSGILCFTITHGIRWLRSRHRPPSPTQTESRAVVLASIDPVLDARKPPDIWNTVIFFPGNDFPSHSDQFTSPTAQLLYYFENAKVKIRMCMYLASLYEIKEIVLRKKKEEGLLVQVITDNDTLQQHSNWNPKAYIRAGINVRAKNTGSLMHNKFVLIDDEAVMTGSLNQTKSGVSSNFENVVITTHKKTVTKYLQEFTKIWFKVEDVTLAMLPRSTTFDFQLPTSSVVS